MPLTNYTATESLGSNGSIFATDADGELTGPFAGFMPLTAAASLESIELAPNSTGEAALLAANIPAGVPVRVGFSSVEVDAGTYQLFKA